MSLNENDDIKDVVSSTDAGSAPQRTNREPRAATPGPGVTVPGTIAEVLDAALASRP
jgi:hypothetical protein